MVGWIVKVPRVVDVYDTLVGRSRSGGVGQVEKAGNGGTGGWSVLVFSEHNIFKQYSQKHGYKG